MIQKVFFYVYKHFDHMYIRVPHACSVQGSQKKMLDPLELTLQVVMSPHVDTGN